MTEDNRETVVVAGASGFVGRNLLPGLVEKFDVIALTRGTCPEETQHLRWRQCDLFSLKQTKRALEGADRAVYLVHSMLPAAQLTQAKFEDLDLLVADNFARAAAHAGIQQIVYLGGIIPKAVELSKHLKSRLEVEQVLAGYGVAVSALRAAMIFGEGGSSMEVLVRLVRRLPYMLCPEWTKTSSNPIYIDDVVRAILQTLKIEEPVSTYFDIAGDTQLSYQKMMRMVGAKLGKHPDMLTVPVISPKLSAFWVSAITGAPRTLIKPLIETLKHDMTPDPGRRFEFADKPPLGFEQILEQSLPAVNEKLKEEKTKLPRAFVLPDDERSQRAVRSVQRLHVNKYISADSLSELYLRWLRETLAPVIRVDQDCAVNCDISLPLLNLGMLKLRRGDRDDESRSVLAIGGGFLAKSATSGRLEFRYIKAADCYIAAIHDYFPTLPWYIYKYTQAVAHLWVMARFRAYLKEKK